MYKKTFSGAAGGGVRYQLSFAVSMLGTHVVMMHHDILAMQLAPSHCPSNELVIVLHKGWSTS